MSGIHLEVPSSCEEAKWQLRVEKTFQSYPALIGIRMFFKLWTVCRVAGRGPGKGI